MKITAALVITALILLYFAIRGYRKGLISVLFSLLAIVITMIVVSMITPTVSNYLVDHTQIYEKIEEKSIATIKEKIENSLTLKMDETTELSENDEEEALDDSGITLPGLAKKNILKNANSLVTNVVEESGICDILGEKVALTLFRIAIFLGCFLVVYLIAYLIYLMVNAIVKLPGIRAVNKGAGFILGLFKGLVIVWVIYLAVSVLSSTGAGSAAVTSIQENEITAFLYDNNLLMYLITIFL